MFPSQIPFSLMRGLRPLPLAVGCVTLLVVGVTLFSPSEYSTVIVERYVKPVVDSVSRGRSVYLQHACEKDR